jgi:2-keto-4-pentenoate hydratase/2-oxohepta-3-ene-1,7-dioic acid hydratase in catechol pathway
MKIAQFYNEGRIGVGLIQDESLIPFDFDGNMIDFIEAEGSATPRRTEGIPLENVRWAPPVTCPSKILALGLNYQDHAKESKGQVPETPLIFAKFPNSVTGHDDEIRWDTKVTTKVDFEAELAVVIGKKVYDCPEASALEAVFGYTCANDVSARDLQFGDGQWVRGKSLDTFCPLGPWMVTTDEIPDPHSLKIQCRLNGELMQDSHTGLMIFMIPSLISFMSRHFTLIPGDIILTGTPHGVGAFRKPPVYMKDGDEVVVEIERVGRLVNTCRAI